MILFLYPDPWSQFLISIINPNCRLPWRIEFNIIPTFPFLDCWIVYSVLRRTLTFVWLPWLKFQIWFHCLFSFNIQLQKCCKGEMFQKLPIVCCDYARYPTAIINTKISFQTLVDCQAQRQKIGNTLDSVQEHVWTAKTWGATTTISCNITRWLSFSDN